MKKDKSINDVLLNDITGGNSEELEIVFALRKAMSTMSVSEITEQLIKQMLETKNNQEFLERMKIFFKNIK